MPSAPEDASFQKVKEWAEGKNVSVTPKPDKIVLKTYWHMTMHDLSDLKDLDVEIDEVYTNRTTENIVVELIEDE